MEGEGEERAGERGTFSKVLGGIDAPAGPCPGCGRPHTALSALPIAKITKLKISH